MRKVMSFLLVLLLSFSSIYNSISIANTYKENTWEENIAQMPTERAFLTTVVIDNKLYCIGGQNSTGSLATVEAYDFSTKKWTTLAPMLTPRHACTSVVVDGKIYVIGGNKASQTLSSIEVYDPITNKWIEETNLPTVRGFV